MALPMEFWGVEVKAGQPLKVNPGEAKIIHLSQASLGESKNSKGNDSVPLFVKFDDQKLVLGTLSAENFPQIAFDLVFEKEFELSHNWKNGSVYFCGYRTALSEEEELSEDESEDELPLVVPQNGKAVSEAPSKPSTAAANAAKPESSAKPRVRIAEPMKVDGEDSDEDDDEDDEEDEDEEGSDSEDDSDEEEDSDQEDEETPKKVDVGKKRPAESAPKTPVSDKKAKVTTPQKTDSKKGGHTATPHPAKQAGKGPANADKSKQSPKSIGQVTCKSCTKSFNSESALQAHSKAKHGAK